MKRMLGLSLLIAGLLSVGCKKEDAGTDQPATTDKATEDNPSAAKTTDQPADKATEEPAQPTDQPADKQEPPAQAAVKTDTPESKAERYIACTAMLVEKNMDGFKGCIADDAEVVQVDSVPAMDMKGPDAFVAFTQMFLTAFPDLKSTPQLVLVNGDNLASMVFTAGTNSGDFGPMKATNKKTGMYEAHTLAMNAEGKVTKMSLYIDQATIFHQLGVAANPMSPDAIETGFAESPTTVVAKNDDAEKANVEQIKKALDLFAKKDAKAYGDLLADDVKFEFHGGKDKAEDKAAYLKGLKEHLAMIKETKTTASNVWAAGDWVVAETEGSATLAKDMPGAKGTKGKTMSGHEIHFFQLAEGKIKQHHIFTNQLHAAVQLGLVKEADLAKAMSGEGAAAPADGAAAPADEAKAGEDKPADEAKAADKKADKKEKKDEGGW